MNQMIEALQGIMNQAQGETIDVPHPADIKNVKEVILTAWHYSVLKADSYKDEEGDRHFDCVQGRVCEIIHEDEYGEPIGEPKLVLQHKYGIPTRQSKDVSVTAIKPQTIRGLKERFPGAFEELERRLQRDGRDLHLALLDSVPPEVISVVMTLGAKTIKNFAEFDDEKVIALVERMNGHKMAARVQYVPEYLQRARERVVELAPPPRRTRQAA